VPADLPVVHGRQTDLAQVFLNLVANAVEAMPRGGTLRVAAAVRGDELEVRIADTGAGIPAEVAERVHDAFVTTKDEGSGLGLPIARSLLSEFDGELHLEAGPDGGTVARVRLPVMEKEGEA
jgi:signal transduction histidine kinase